MPSTYLKNSQSRRDLPLGRLGATAWLERDSERHDAALAAGALGGEDDLA
jgi:hypothetical protein